MARPFLQVGELKHRSVGHFLPGFNQLSHREVEDCSHILRANNASTPSTQSRLVSITTNPRVNYFITNETEAMPVAITPKIPKESSDSGKSNRALEVTTCDSHSLSCGLFPLPCFVCCPKYKAMSYTFPHVLWLRSWVCR